MSKQDTRNDPDDSDDDDLDDEDLEAFLEKQIAANARSEHRRQLEARQTQYVGTVSTVAISPNVQTVPVGEVVPLFIQALGIDDKKSVDTRNIAGKYAEQLELAVALGDVKLLDPVSRLEEKRKDLPWDAVQRHLITRRQLEDFALARLGIDITDEADSVDSALSNAVMAALDKKNPYYARELDLALRAWYAVAVMAEPSTKQAAKKQIMDWLDDHARSLPDEAKKRIAIICNWNKSGGAPKT